MEDLKKIAESIAQEIAASVAPLATGAEIGPKADLTGAMSVEAETVFRESHVDTEMPHMQLSSIESGLSSDRKQAPRTTANMDLLLDVNLPVAIELGRTRMTIAQLLELGSGSIVELDKLAGDPVDILVNNKLLAKGEVVVIDEKFGVRITSLVSPRERLERLKP